MMKSLSAMLRLAATACGTEDLGSPAETSGLNSNGCLLFTIPGKGEQTDHDLRPR